MADLVKKENEEKSSSILMHNCIHCGKANKIKIKGTDNITADARTHNHSEMDSDAHNNNLSALSGDKKEVVVDKKETTKGNKLDMINSYRGKLEETKERFKDIRIPLDFRANYELS